MNHLSIIHYPLNKILII